MAQYRHLLLLHFGLFGGDAMKLSLEPPRKSAPSCDDWQLCIDLKPIAAIHRRDIVLVERLIAERDDATIECEARMGKQ